MGKLFGITLALFLVVQFATGAFTPGGNNLMPELVGRMKGAWNETVHAPATQASQPQASQEVQAQQTQDARVSHNTHAQPPHTVQDGVVKSIVDGDTIDLADGRRIRILQIDAPESTTPESLECGGRDAKSALTRLIPPGTRLHIQHDPQIEKEDAYGRTLAYPLRANDHLNIAQRMVGLGWATPYYYNGKRGMYSKNLDQAKNAAANKGQGMWTLCVVRGWSDREGVNPQWS